MKRIDFYISNNNHHWDNFRPVIQILIERGYQVRLISLCELRRMRSPDTSDLNIQIIQLFSKIKGLKTSSGSKGIGGNQSILRNVLRYFLWIFLLRIRLKKVNRYKPDLVIVPNDVAFPYNYICSFLKKHGISFFLFQEGIRFALPNERGLKPYGTNGAELVMVWGEKSARYFQELGCKVAITGSPRYDELLRKDYSLEEKHFESRFNRSDFNILFASNPIDDQGFCSRDLKLLLFEKFLHLLSQNFSSNTHLFIRLHPREDMNLFTDVVNRSRISYRVSFVQDVPLFVLFRKVDLVVVFASTIGLEAIVSGARLAVLKIPGYDYQFDYVQSGVGIPIDVMNDNNFSLKNVSSDLLNLYWRSYIHHDGMAAHRIVDKIISWFYAHESR